MSSRGFKQVISESKCCLSPTKGKRTGLAHLLLSPRRRPWSGTRRGGASTPSTSSSPPCPAFSSLAVTEDGFYEWVFNSESFTEDYVLLLFLPMDGNVDKAELEAFSAEVYQLASLSCQVGNLNQTNIDHSKRWLPSRGTVWPPFARLTTIYMKTVVFEQISNLICFSGLPLAKQASPSSATRASPSPRLLG